MMSLEQEKQVVGLHETRDLNKSFSAGDREPNVRIVPLFTQGGASPKSSGQTQWLRIVDPYRHAFTSFVKGRWLGRTILDVYVTEFPAYPASYYRYAIGAGLIQVGTARQQPRKRKRQASTSQPTESDGENNKHTSTEWRTVPLTYQLCGTDILRLIVHRHEPACAVPLSQSPYVRFCQSDCRDVWAVDKPATLPVHPCGGYHENSLVSLLRRDQFKNNSGGDDFLVLHRLDRLTSGLVLLARSSTVAGKWAQAIREGNCTKTYLARVRGRFPYCSWCGKRNGNVPLWTKADLPEGNPIGGSWTCGSKSVKEAFGAWFGTQDNKTILDMSVDDFVRNEHDLHNLDEDKKSQPWLNFVCPVRKAQPKDGICESGPFHEKVDADVYGKTVKSAHTSFSVLSYDKSTDTTLVLCRPVTGRTHQIRLHLQRLGHPIANDPNYGGNLWFGDTEAARLSHEAQERLDTAPGSCLVTTDTPATVKEIKVVFSGGVNEKDDKSCTRESSFPCVWCARMAGQPDRNRLEFLVRSRGIWLHALQYSVSVDGTRHTFRAHLPHWANANF